MIHYTLTLVIGSWLLNVTAWAITFVRPHSVLTCCWFDAGIGIQAFVYIWHYIQIEV